MKCAKTLCACAALAKTAAARIAGINTNILAILDGVFERGFLSAAKHGEHYDFYMAQWMCFAGSLSLQGRLVQMKTGFLAIRRFKNHLIVIHDYMQSN